VIAIVDRNYDRVAQAMSTAAGAHGVDGHGMRLAAAATGAAG
jgi:hypothetical protein